MTGSVSPSIATSGDLHTQDTSAPPGPQPAPQYRGFHEGATSERISGWAWDSTRPDEPIDVDIYDDDTLLATVTANTFRRDLLDGRIGNGEHGFVYTPPARVQNGQTHLIRVRIAGIDVDLKNTPKSIAPGGPSQRYQGAHDRADGERISGWAWDSTRPDEPIDVDIYDGDTLLATVTADTFRQDLLQADIGDGRHAFVYALPAGLKDGRTHVIRVKISGTAIELKNTPKSITCGGSAPIYQGAHGKTDCTRIYGWAWDSTRPDAPIAVDIYDGNTLLATVPADIFHQSLLDAGKGNGRHVFIYALPDRLKDGRSHTIRVRIAGTSIDLKHTPKRITFPSE